MPSTHGFGDAELIDTINSYPFAGVDSDLSREERFARGVAHAVRARIRSYPSRIGSHAVFLLEPTVPESLDGASRDPFYALDDGETDVTTGLWFVGAPVIQGTRLEAPATFDEMFPHVVEAGLGDVAAVTFRRSSSGPMLRFYPDGLANPDRRVSMTVEYAVVDIAKVLEIVDIVHRSTLVTPSGHQGGAKLWKNRAKHHPARNVEVEIQAYLRTGLSVGLPLCRINAEQNLVAGRLDLEIEELDPATRTLARHAILELKVLRTFGSTGARTSAPQTERWVRDGVDQAHTYQSERGAAKSALCCFDMRVNVGDDACLKKVENRARKLKVIVCAWPIFPDAKLFRAAAASAALSAGSLPKQS